MAVSNLETLYFKNIAELCDEISDRYNSLNDEFADFSVIAKYDEAKEIIRELLCIGHEIASVEIYREEFDNYYDEYIITLDFNGVWCERFKRDSGYIRDDSSITFVSNECNSACLPCVKSKIVYAFEISEDEDECEDKEFTDLDTSDSESTYVSRDKNGVAHGFSRSWSTTKDGVNCYSSYSHYSSDIEGLKEIAGRFGVRL